MFPSTLSIGRRSHLHGSTLLQGLADRPGPSASAAPRPAVLGPSLLDDLRRFERHGASTALIEVLAASLRHGQDLLIDLSYGSYAMPVTLFPAQRLVHSPLPLEQLLALRLPELAVQRVKPAERAAPAVSELDPADPERQLLGPMDVFSWDVAMRGTRSELLPEIPPLAAYRIPPGVTVQGVDIGGTHTAALHRLKRKAANLRDISAWAGFDRERATRLLNALYLQSALMATRTHPAALFEGW